MSTNPPEEEGWTKPSDKKDGPEITIRSVKHAATAIPERIEKKMAALYYHEGEIFQIGKNKKAILNREVPPGYQFTVYVRVIIEKNPI